MKCKEKLLFKRKGSALPGGYFLFFAYYRPGPLVSPAWMSFFELELELLPAPGAVIQPEELPVEELLPEELLPERLFP